MSSSSTKQEGETLTNSTLNSMSVGKIFRDCSKHITSIDFDAKGEFCVTASQDESIHLYDCKQGRQVRTIYSKKYGCDLARFTHSQNNIIYASTKEDDTIRYLSLYDNKYLRYFKGHTQRVTCLEMSPMDDLFLSSSIDQTIRLWDTRTPVCQGIINLQEKNNAKQCVAFDHAGYIFAVGIDSYRIHLYDLKDYQNGPFEVFEINVDTQGPVEWTSLKFSNDGKYILISTNVNIIYVIDAYEGTVLQTIEGFENKCQLNLAAGFTPDVKYIYSGSQDGSINFWERETGKHVAKLHSHNEPSSVVLFNPRYLMFASADVNLVFWIPKEYLGH